MQQNQNGMLCRRHTNRCGKKTDVQMSLHLIWQKYNTEISLNKTNPLIIAKES